MSYIIDTQSIINIVIGKAKDNQLGTILKQISEHQNLRLNLSVISHGELMYYIDGLDRMPRHQALDQYNQFLAAISPGQILEFTTNIAETWAQITAIVTPHEFPDVTSEELLIAATAVRYGHYLICPQNDWAALVPNLQVEMY